MDASSVKKRDAEATRERILTCAKRLFSEKGFDAASTREIAACANVNSALVARYFGSKKELFEQAILPEIDIAPMLAISNENLAEDIAEMFVAKPPKDGADPFMALLHSVGNSEVGELVQTALNDRLIKPLGEKLGGPAAETKAAILISHLAGFDLFRRTIQIDALTQSPKEDVKAILQKSIASLF